MSDISRRDALRRVGLLLMTTGVVDRISAQEVHQMAGEMRAAAGGPYTPKALSAHAYATLERLTDLIIPVENGAPGAVTAGAAGWIDMMASENDELKAIYTTGLAWMDKAMVARGEGLPHGAGRPADGSARSHRLPAQRGAAGPGARDRVLQLGAPHDGRRVLHESRWH